MYGFDYSVPLFVTRVRGMCIVVTPDIVYGVLRVPKVEHLDYLGCDRLRIVSKDELISSFCKHPSNWVIVSSPLVRPLLKALGFLTWS